LRVMTSSNLAAARRAGRRAMAALPAPSTWPSWTPNPSSPSWRWPAMGGWSSAAVHERRDHTRRPSVCSFRLEPPGWARPRWNMPPRLTLVGFVADSRPASSGRLHPREGEARLLTTQESRAVARLPWYAPRRVADLPRRALPHQERPERPAAAPDPAADPDRRGRREGLSLR
jgi:hypothetical protein